MIQNHEIQEKMQSGPEEQGAVFSEKCCCICCGNYSQEYCDEGECSICGERNPDFCPVATEANTVPSEVFPEDLPPRLNPLRDLAAFKANQQHQEILNAVLNVPGDLVIEAVAGSGKTSLLRWLTQYFSDDVLIAAFNRSFKDELDQKDKRPGTVIETTYALGFQLIKKHRSGKKIEVDKNKYSCIVDEILFPYLKKKEAMKAIKDSNDEEGDDSEALAGAFRQLINFARFSLVPGKDKKALLRMVERYGLDILQLRDEKDKNFILKSVAVAMEHGESAAKEGVTNKDKYGAEQIVYPIDFADMIWLPHVWQLYPLRKYRFVMVDECQDLSRAQFDLVQKFRSEDGKMIFVGDRHQAIYGFAGADAESFQRIIDTTNAKTYPLSFTRRCPKKIVKLAQEIVPAIVALPEALDGEVEDSFDFKMLKEAIPGDMVLSRKKAPLVRLCINFIKNHKPATIIGRDISSQLTSIVQAVAKGHNFSWSNFLDALDEYIGDKLERLIRKKAEGDVLQEWKDRKEAIEACFEEWRPLSAEEFCSKIRSIFSDEEQKDLKNRIRLSTVHKAKGLEANRVYIVGPQYLPLVWKDQKAWQHEQEMNLKYVALTRSRATLVFVR